MATYRFKRKNFGLMEGAKQATGTVVQGAGDIIDSAPGRAAGFIGGIGAMGAGASAGAALGSVAGPVGSLIGGAVGGLATPFLAKDAVHGVGKALHNTGQDMKYSV